MLQTMVSIRIGNKLINRITSLIRHRRTGKYKARGYKNNV